jgi:hypothetical protein
MLLKITLTEEQRDRIIYLRETGSTLEEIKLEVGTIYECVRDVLRDNKTVIKLKKVNVPPPYTKRSSYDHLFDEPMNQGKKDYNAYVRDGR